MSGIKLKRIGKMMEPEPGNPTEVEGVLNPAAARGADGRSVIAIGNGIPSRGCIEANAHALARYAALCQEAGLVPVVEPEVLMDGDHSLEKCFDDHQSIISNRSLKGQTIGQLMKNEQEQLLGKLAPE
jgi:fructose-bisphosphate aldolase class 1